MEGSTPPRYTDRQTERRAANGTGYHSRPQLDVPTAIFKDIWTCTSVAIIQYVEVAHHLGIQTDRRRGGQLMVPDNTQDLSWTFPQPSSRIYGLVLQ
ncbi:hypothetical protein J6590_030810 [Homalodisca vitripennis]|nr:hypothetical protein J6590_030810 [Homalodisca vitripennis]